MHILCKTQVNYVNETNQYIHDGRIKERGRLFRDLAYGAENLQGNKFRQRLF